MTLYRSCECVLLFVAAPVAVALVPWRVHFIPLLWGLTALCTILLWIDPTFDRQRFGRARELRALGPRILRRFVVLAALLAAFTAATMPERLFGFVRSRPGLWALVMVLYPLLSVYPQGIIYRAFFFHRYRRLFGDGAAMTIAAAIAFSLAHVALRNGLAPAMTLVGGLLFAETYRRSRSLVVSGVEHSLYGCFIFTIGLGWYFYNGPRLGGGRP